MQQNFQFVRNKTANKLLWITRGLSVFIAIWVASMLSQVFTLPFPFRQLEVYAVYFFLTVTSISLLLAWGWERLGGILAIAGTIGTVISLYLFVSSFGHPVSVDGFMTGMMTFLPLLNAVLFLLAGREKPFDTKSRK